MSGFKDIVKGGWHPDKDVPIKDSLVWTSTSVSSVRYANHMHRKVL